MAEEWHKYQREDREALVKRNDEGFFVELYELGRLLEVRKVYSRSEYYAEDVAENWVDGIISSPNNS